MALQKTQTQIMYRAAIDYKLCNIWGWCYSALLDSETNEGIGRVEGDPDSLLLNIPDD